MRGLLISAGVLGGLLSAAYLALALWCMVRYRLAPAGRTSPQDRPAVTVLKPLCGFEPRLYDCLRSFCVQQGCDLQIVFGVQDASDPAIAVAQRLIGEFPGIDMKLVIDPQTHGANLKVGNMINMMPLARHDIIVISDSDTCVRPDDVARAVAPLAAPGVGATTCLYRSAPEPDVASTFGAMFIDDWFLTSAVVNSAIRPVTYCFGPLSAVRRDALEKIGGLEAIADKLADDDVLGQLIHRAGYKVVLADPVVTTVVAETWGSLVRRELRWARTVRTAQRFGHLLSVVTCALPIVWLAALGPAWLAAPLIGATLAMRLALHALTRRRFGIVTRSPLWLVPIREIACFLVWAASLAGQRVVWRDRSFTVRPGGVLVSQGLRT